MGFRIHPIEGANKTRPAYLPSGNSWYDFWTNKCYAGGQNFEAEAGLETMPLYVRAGSIVPVGPEVQFTGEKPDAPLELRVYAGQDGSFTLYEDEDDNYGYEQGAFSTIRLDWKEASRTLTIGERRGSYPGMTASREFRVTLVDGSGQELQAKDRPVVKYEGQQVKIVL